MKKKIILLLIVMLIVIAVFNMKHIARVVLNGAIHVITMQLDKEEKERLEAIERGEIVRGKDTMLIWNNKYEMLHQAGDDGFFKHNDDGAIDKIIGKINKHKVIKNKLYIASNEGYVTVDENNLCKVLITIPKEEFINGYSKDENGNRTYFYRFVEDENIIYLTSFEEFTEEEQKILNKRLIAK